MLYNCTSYFLASVAKPFEDSHSASLSLKRCRATFCWPFARPLSQAESNLHKFTQTMLDIYCMYNSNLQNLQKSSLFLVWYWNATDFFSYTALDLFHRRLFKVSPDEMNVNVKPISWAQSHLSARKIRTSQSFEIFFQHFLLLLICVTFWSSRWSWRCASTMVSMPFSNALEYIQSHAFSLLKMKFGDLPVSTRWLGGFC